MGTSASPASLKLLEKSWRMLLRSSNVCTSLWVSVSPVGGESGRAPRVARGGEVGEEGSAYGVGGGGWCVQPEGLFLFLGVVSFGFGSLSSGVGFGGWCAAVLLVLVLVDRCCLGAGSVVGSGFGVVVGAGGVVGCFGWCWGGGGCGGRVCGFCCGVGGGDGGSAGGWFGVGSCRPVCGGG